MVRIEVNDAELWLPSFYATGLLPNGYMDLNNRTSANSAIDT